MGYQEKEQSTATDRTHGVADGMLYTFFILPRTLHWPRMWSASYAPRRGVTRRSRRLAALLQEPGSSPCGLCPSEGPAEQKAACHSPAHHMVDRMGRVTKVAIYARIDEEGNRLGLIDEGRDTGLVAGTP